ncbi:MAG: HEPN domain-containing protein [Culicoidibacterales bacterium]
MTGEISNAFNDVDNELENIRKHINKNRFEINTKYLISYAVIRACGTIEIVYKKLIHEFLTDGAKPETGQYLSKIIIDSSSNPKTGNIERMLSDIDHKLCEDFKTRFSSGEKDGLNSLVQNRNNFAHGQTVTITIGTLIKYFASSKKILTHLKDTLDKMV